METTKNQDIVLLRACKGMLDEIRMLRERDETEMRALLGSPKLDGMPRGAGGAGGIEDVIARAQDIHAARLKKIDAYEEQIRICEAVLEKAPAAHRALIRALYVEQMPIWRAAQVVHMSEATAKRIKAEYEKKSGF